MQKFMSQDCSVCWCIVMMQFEASQTRSWMPSLDTLDDLWQADFNIPSCSDCGLSLELDICDDTLTVKENSKHSLAL